MRPTNDPLDILLRKDLHQRNVAWMPKPFSRGMKPYEPVPLNLPACALGMLTVTFTDDKIQYGCGAIINSNVVLTAAENLFDRATNQQATRVCFTASTLEGGVYHAVKWHFPQEYKTAPDPGSFNVAVLQLNQCVHSKLGFLGVNFTNSQHLGCCLFGYRKDQRLTFVEEVQLTQTDAASPIVNTEFRHDDDSEFLKGTPLLAWNKQHDDIQVVGVYLGGKKSLRLTNNHLTKLKQKLPHVPEEQLILWNKNNPKQILEKLVDSADQWQNRIFMLGILFNKHKPSCSRILEKAVWSNLRNLNLFDCDLLDDDLYDLTRGHFPVLDKLYLPSNQFGNEGIISLCRGSWADLCELYIWGIQVTISVLYPMSRDLSQIRVFEISEGKHGMPELFKSKIRVVYGREVALKV